jgi:O-antigen/teichoic acid export membrane protein
MLPSTAKAQAGEMSSETPPSSFSVKSISKALGGYSVPMVLQRCISILLLPIYTYYLRPADYAVLELLDLVGSIVSLLLGFRIGQALFYYYFRAKNQQDRDLYVSTAFLAVIGIGALAAAAIATVANLGSIFIFGDNSHSYIVRVFFLGLAATFPMEFGLCYLRVRDRVRSYATVSVARILGSLVLNLVFLAGFRMGAISIVYATLAVNACITAYMFWVVFSEVRPRFERRRFFEMMRYSMPLGLSGLGELALHFGDRFFLRPNVSLATLGVYSLAYKIGMLITFATGPFYNYWNAQMVRIVQQRDGDRTYSRVATYFLLAFGYLAVLLGLSAKPMLRVMAPADYQAAGALIPWICFAYVIRGCGSYFLNTFLIENRPGTVARITWLAAAVCLAGYALLIPRFKLWGAVAATLIGFLVIFVVGLWKSQRLHRFPYEYQRWVKIAVSTAGMLVLALVLRPSTFWGQVGVACSGAVLFPVLLILQGFLEPDERQFLRVNFIKVRQLCFGGAW